MVNHILSGRCNPEISRNELRDLNFRVIFFAIMLMVFAGEAWAATISVNTADIAAVSGDGKCSLLEAIQAANTDTTVDACQAGSGADVIELQAYTTYTQNVNTDQASESAFWLTINSEITINGNGAKIVKTGSAPTGRFIVVNPEGNLTLNDLTVSNKAMLNPDNPSSSAIDIDRGILTINRCNIRENNDIGILSMGGKMNVNNSTIDQNNGVGISNSSGVSGNPLTLFPSKGSFINNSVIINNKCGGIIHSNMVSDTAYMEITKSIIKANGSNNCSNIDSSKTTYGIQNNGNNTFILIRDSIISENIGGGLYNQKISSTFTVINSTISDNKNGTTGNNGDSGNGIINLLGSKITLINSTVSGNLSTGSGGGIVQAFGSQLRVINSTITNNKSGVADINGKVSEQAKGGGIYNLVNSSGQSGTVEVINSIITGNFTPTNNYPDVSGPITGNHNNLIGNITGATGTIGTGTDIVNPNPLLDTLKNNGGFTQTHALLAGSPAIDKGDNAICAGSDVGNIDQRGKTRPYGSACDIGAYEYRPYNTDVILEAISNPSPICPGDNFDVTFKISSATSFIETNGYLYFDPKVLQVNSMDKKFTGVFSKSYDNAKGIITFGANTYTQFSNINPFFTVNFKVIGMNSGSTILDFDSSKNKTYDMNGDQLSQTSEDVTIGIAYPTTDKDADGVLNTVENGAPAGDGNGDGIFDSLQNNVTSLPSVVTNNYITLEVSPASCAVKNVISKTEKDAGSGNEDSVSDYPQGLIEFDMPCDTANIRVLYHGITVENSGGADFITVNAVNIPLSSLKYRKYGPTPPGFTLSGWYDMLGASFGKQTIGGKNILVASFTLNDGQLGDDTAKDGKIYDAGGLAISLPPQIILGDINDSKGNPDLSDAILALQVAAGLNPPNVNPGADVSSDNKIGLEEVIYILQKVAGLR